MSKVLPVVLLVALVGFAAVPSAGQQSLTRVRDILRDAPNYPNFINHEVTVEGVATQWVEGRGSTTFYTLKDDWGDPIKVRTTRERPVIGDRCRVQGVVGVDVANGYDVYVSEELRTDGKPAPPPPPPWYEDLPWGLVTAVCVALLCLVVLLVWVLRSRGAQPQVFPVEPLTSNATPLPPPPSRPASMSIPSPPPSPADSNIPPPPRAGSLSSPIPPPPTGTAAMTAPILSSLEPQVVEGRTIKFYAPPPGTLKILPGRLAVAGGDDTIKELRFFKAAGESTPEVTFGRAAGTPFIHIQLKSPTVSTRQAKLTYINSQWILTNFAAASSNPTRVNELELPVDGQVALSDGDAIEMGEVRFIFHNA